MTERLLEVRSFIGAPFAVPDEGNLVTGLLVPFDEVATIYDPVSGETFQEQFDHGAFERISGAPNRVLFRMSHSSEYGAQVGYGVALEERENGLYGTFKLAEEGESLRKTKAFLRDCYTGLSVGFAPIKNRTENNVIHRTLVHLEHVAACVLGAYSGAKVLTVRSAGRPALETPQGTPLQAPDPAEQTGTETPNLEEMRAWLASKK